MLYVTKLEKENHEATENLTKAQLKTAILDVITKLPENEAKIMQDHFKRSIKSKNKEDYLNFYEEINELAAEYSTSSQPTDEKDI